MPRSNWKGNISFGLVSIPIVLFNSEEPKSHVAFKQINLKTGARIKYKRIDTETEQEVPWEQIGRGYEYGKDVILPVKEGELERVAGENARTIAIEEFIDKKNLTFLNVEKTYYLVPDKKADKGYVILREALNAANKVGIAKVIISTKEYLAAVATYENALVLHLLRYQDEIRDISEFNLPTDDLKKYKVTSKEIEVAKQLINAMSAKWKPEKFKDEYKAALDKWVKEKIHHLPESHMAPRAPQQKKNNKVVDFVELLRQSMQVKKPRQKVTNGKKIKVTRKTPTAPRKSARTH